MIFPLILLNPTTKKTYSINWLEISIDNKKLVIQYGHTPLIAALDKNSQIIFGLATGAQESIMINAGIIAIERTRAMLIQE